jgi:hypothetical protein
MYRTVFPLIAITAGLSAADYSWKRTDTTVALMTGDKVVWQLVHDAKADKPYFHPLATVDGDVITGLRPEDHVWHRGLWWSWKFINGVNYWEEDPNTLLSAGRSEITSVEVQCRDDHSASITLAVSYHPPGAPPVMTERRVLDISAPTEQGVYAIDWTSHFTVGDAEVTLGRTAPYEKKGRWGGGYAGLALRGPVEHRQGWTFTDSNPEIAADKICNVGSRWVDFHGVFASGATGGAAILDHPSNGGHPVPFYANLSHPFLHPAVLWRSPLKLAAKAEVAWRYRIVVHRGPTDRAFMDAQWKDFAAR